MACLYCSCPSWWICPGLKDKAVKKEVDGYRAALEDGHVITLKELRPYSNVIGEEWFSNLRMDPESLSDPTARPRQ